MRRFESLSGLTRILKIGIGVSLALELATVYVAFNLIGLMARLEAGTAGTEEANAHDILETLAALGELPVFIVVVVLFLIWVNRANKNLDAIGIQDKEFTSGWAVGW